MSGKKKMWDKFVLMLSKEDSHSCDVAKVTYVHVQGECLRVWNVILGQALLCLLTHPQCAPLNKGMGRRKADLAPLRAEEMIHVHIYLWFALHVYDANVCEPKAEKNFWPWNHVVSQIIVGMEVTK